MDEEEKDVKSDHSGSPKNSKWWRHKYTLTSLFIVIAVVAVPLAFYGRWLRQEPPDITTILVDNRRSAFWKRVDVYDFNRLNLQPAGQAAAIIRGSDDSNSKIIVTRQEIIDRDCFRQRRGHIEQSGQRYRYILEGEIYENGDYHLVSTHAGGWAAGNALYEKIKYFPESRTISLTLGEQSPKGYQIVELKMRVLDDGNLELVSINPDK